GSAALGREDRWSDVDLALSVAADREQVLAEWTDRMYREHAAVDHLDVVFGATVFRVFLLASTLQVDVAFWPNEDFGPTGPAGRPAAGNGRPMTETVLTGAEVFDPETGSLTRADVLVRDDRIAEVGSILDGGERVDCSSGVLIPGLIDCHVHVAFPHPEPLPRSARILEAVPVLRRL